jgi:hypothetical protein
LRDVSPLVAELIEHSMASRPVACDRNSTDNSQDVLLSSLARCGLVRRSQGAGSHSADITDQGRAVLAKLRSGCRLVWRDNCLELTRPAIGPMQQTHVVCRWWTGRPTPQAPDSIYTPSTLLQTMKHNGILADRLTSMPAVHGNRVRQPDRESRGVAHCVDPWRLRHRLGDRSCAG